MVDKNLYFNSFDGTRICYQYTKKGKKCLVFVHGLGGDMTAWDPERKYFEELGYSTIALDLRGHGLSERVQKPEFYEFKNFARDIGALIEHTKVEKPVLIGHCFGGIVSLFFTSEHQNMLSALALIDSSYKPPHFLGHNELEYSIIEPVLGVMGKFIPEFHTEGHRDFSKFKGTEDVDIRRFTSDVLHTSIKGYILMCQKLTGYDGKKLLGKINIPTFIMEGEEDTIFPPDIAEYLSQRIKKSDLEFIPKANHILVINNIPEVNRSLERFLVRINYE